jgi:hypothetical protein
MSSWCRAIECMVPVQSDCNSFINGIGSIHMRCTSAAARRVSPRGARMLCLCVCVCVCVRACVCGISRDACIFISKRYTIYMEVS